MGPQEQSQLAAKYTLEGGGHANEGWQIYQDVVSMVCTDFDDILFETVLKSVGPSTKVNRMVFQDQVVGAWQLISVNVNC